MASPPDARFWRNAPIDLCGEISFEVSYRRLLPALRELSPNDSRALNLDVVKTAMTVLGAAPKIAALRPAFVADLPHFDVAQVDLLEDCARALCHARTQYAAACDPPDELPALRRAGLAARSLLKGDAEQGVRRGLVPAAALRGLSGGIGFLKLGRDLQLLSAVLRAHFSDLEGKCGVELAELDRVDGLAARLFSAVARRRRRPAATGEAAELLRRAYALCIKTYDDVRRAVIFLRWHHGDADTIAPSLYAGRGGRGKRRASDEGKPDSGAVVAPIPDPGATTLSSSTPSSTPSPAASPTAAALGMNRAAFGSEAHPGAEPSRWPWLARRAAQSGATPRGDRLAGRRGFRHPGPQTQELGLCRSAPGKAMSGSWLMVGKRLRATG